MATKHKTTEQQGLPLSQLAGGQIGWAVSQLVLTRANRFHNFQKAVQAPSEPSLEMLGARMVAFDGLQPNALRLLEAQNAKPYRLSDQIAIEWVAAEPSRTERRLLCPMTLLAWPRSHDDELVSIRGLAAALKRWLPTLGHQWAEDTAWEDLSGDQLCWLQEKVPGTLVGHLSCMAPLSALPRSTWARQELHQPLQIEISEDISDSGATGTLIQAALD